MTTASAPAPGAGGADLRGLEALALGQGGYFDRRDALDHGLGDDALSHHARAGRFERVFPGVYRLTVAPYARHDELLRAWVWTNYRGAISHESALALFGLSDVAPTAVHLTVPFGFRREVPPGAPFALHRSQLDQGDTIPYEGVRATEPARTIVDAAAAGTGPEQIVLAVRQGLERALVDPERLRAAAARRRYRHRRTVLPLIEAALARAARPRDSGADGPAAAP
jgi:predicted transcriptional regulator of viral defense system